MEKSDTANNNINTDGKKRRSLSLTLFFAAADDP